MTTTDTDSTAGPSSSPVPPAGQGLAAALLLDEAGARVIATDIADAAPALDGTRVVYRRLDVVRRGWRGGRSPPILRPSSTASRCAVSSTTPGSRHAPASARRERADWDRVLAVNLTGPMLGIQALAPLMGERLVDRQHRLVGRAQRALSGRVHVEQVGPARAHARRRDRARAARHPGQHRASGLHRDADDRERTRRDARRAARAHSARARSAARTRSRAWSSSCCRMPRPTSRGAEIPVDGGSTSSAGVKYMADRIAGAPEARLRHPAVGESRACRRICGNPPTRRDSPTFDRWAMRRADAAAPTVRTRSGCAPSRARCARHRRGSRS